MRAVPPYRVLVLPGGTEIGLEIQRGLSHLRDIELIGGGSGDDAHGPFAYRQWVRVPNVDEPDWCTELVRVLTTWRIDFVFPAHDDVLVALAERREDLPAVVLAPSVDTCQVTRSKRRTYAALAGVVPVPRILDHADIDQWPVFAKPDRSQGSRGAALAHDARELRALLESGSDLVMEYLPGREYTVDCFSDRERGVLFASGRERVRTRAGISMSSTIVHDQTSFEEMAARIGDRLHLHGAWFYQVREDRDGRPTLLEVAPRVAGTMALSRVRGVNFPLLTIYEYLRSPVRILTHDVEVSIDRALVNRYRHDLQYDAVYVDLDDTLIVEGQVNASLAAFLYQCINRGVRLVLVTRHRADLGSTLRHHRLAQLFDEVIHIQDDMEDKAVHVRPSSILIDDSFRERAAVSAAVGIPTFDSSMVEMLLDPRS